MVSKLVSMSSKLLPPALYLYLTCLYPLPICCTGEHKEQQQMTEGYNSHPSLYGVCEQQASRSIDLLILLLDVA